MKRIAIGQLQMESNTFNPQPTLREEFVEFGWAEGADVVERFGHTDELAGFSHLPALLGEPMEWVGLVRAKALAGGPMADAVVAEVVAIMQNRLRRTPVDGVLFSLHGAMAATTIPGLDGYILAKLREAVGPDVPVVVTLDLHANLTREMITAADVLVGFHTFPHIDHESCGRRAAAALVNLMRHGRGFQVAAVKVPFLVSGKGYTTTGNLVGDLYRRLVDAESSGAALSAGLYMAQPWLDVPELGWTLYQAWRGEQPPLDFQALAEECWELRRHSARRLPSPEEIADEALRMPGHPIVVSEGHDSTNSGAPGDSTRLIAALLQREWPDAGALSYCVDPAAVARCHEAGEGASFRLKFGGVLDPFSEPLEIPVTVRRLGRVDFIHSGHAGLNLRVNMGRVAAVVAGSVTLLFTEHKGLGSTPRLYEEAGLDPRRYKFVSAKSPEGFRHDYAHIGAGFLYTGAPGCAWEQLEQLPFRHVPRPLFPLDDLAARTDATWAWRMNLHK